MVKIYHLSDTHTFHGFIKLPDGRFDITIHSGDESNDWNSISNEQEFFNFLEWYSNINEQSPNFYTNHKILIAGNHSSYIYKMGKTVITKICKDAGIIYLDKESVVLEGLKIYGDPISPKFGSWYFMAHRSKMHKHWNLIPRDIDILVTHTPPQNILDIGIDLDNGHMLSVGCRNLRRQVEDLYKLQLHCFGHIHSKGTIENFGTKTINDFSKREIIFSNAACVKDREFHRNIVYNGNIFELQ